MMILIQSLGYVFATVQEPILPRSLFPFLDNYSTAAALSDCPPIFLSEVVSNRTNSTISQYYTSKYPASNTIDNNENTRWSSRGDGSYLTVSPGSPFKICDLGIAWYLGDHRSFNFAVDISNNGSDFVNIYTNQSSGTPNSSEVYHIPDVNATSLRLTVNGSDANSFAHVSDLKLYGSPLGT
jgi:hypothetical protein